MTIISTAEKPELVHLVLPNFTAEPFMDHTSSLGLPTVVYGGSEQCVTIISISDKPQVFHVVLSNSACHECLVVCLFYLILVRPYNDLQYHY